MIRSSIHERRADSLASLLRPDEDALDIRGQPPCRSRSRNARDERDPGHPDDLRSEESSNERQMRVLAGRPPLRELRRERINGPLDRFLIKRVQPQQPSQFRNVARIRLTNPHKTSLPSTVLTSAHAPVPPMLSNRPPSSAGADEPG